MCGRYTLTTPPGTLQAAFDLHEMPQGVVPHYNIAPSQLVAVITNEPPRRLQFFRWGLIPSWATDPSIGQRLINARAETLGSKPSFRNALRRRRCLVPADGFFEWQKSGRQKTPMYVRLTSRQPFAFAGLWETWQAPDAEPVASCTIITTDANALVAAIHNRMPVILRPECYAAWLDPAPREPADLGALLVPFPDELLEAFAVSPLVNSPANDRPECLTPA